ncbi:MAG: hypothetical protein ACRDPO_20410 [Streptosporangiaceae bacterium]
MARIALATASDGRDFVHEEVGPFGLDVQDRLAAALRERGHEVLTGEGDLSSNADAVRLGRELAAARPDLTLINYPVWAFPHFSLLFASQGSGPLALFSNIDPQYPGMVGMLAAGGGFDQVGRKHSRTWGDPADPAVIDRLSRLAVAASVTQGLRGMTFGRIGDGRWGCTPPWPTPISGWPSSASTSRTSTSTSWSAAGRRWTRPPPRRPGCGWSATPPACTTTARS